MSRIMIETTNQRPSCMLFLLKMSKVLRVSGSAGSASSAISRVQTSCARPGRCDSGSSLIPNPQSRIPSPSTRWVDVRRRDVVHRVARPQRQSALAQLAVDRQLVMLVARVGDPVDREHAAPALAVLRKLLAADGGMIVLDVEADDRAPGYDADVADRDRRRRVVDLERG